jgi:hypothetical protein
MKKKKAFLVTFEVTTRICAVPDEDGELKDDDVDKARYDAIEKLKSGDTTGYVKDYTEDTEVPYDETDDDNSDL